MKNKCIRNVSLFGADFEQEAPYFFEKEAGQAATVNSISQHDNIFLPKFDDIDAIYGFNKTMPRAI